MENKGYIDFVSEPNELYSTIEGVLHEHFDVNEEDIFSAANAVVVAIRNSRPTAKMIVEGAKAMSGFATSGGGVYISGEPKDVWRAMASAFPVGHEG